MVKDNNIKDSGEIDLEGDYRPTFRDFYDLMKFKVTKILLVSSLYDAFILEEEGFLIEQISGEYRDLELTSPPQVVRVPSGEEALKEFKQRRYDLIITMSHIRDLDPYEFAKRAKAIKSSVPVVLLVTNPQSVPMLYHPGEREPIDKVFYWTGDSALFIAITKYIEDSINVDADTELGLVKAILVIEDSPIDYSNFLPVFYTEIVKQTEALISVGLNEQEKWLRKKTRPKILLAETFEEGVSLYNKYKDHLLGIITDLSYKRGGEKIPEAGFQFIEEIVDTDIPVLMQSAQEKYKEKAKKLGIPFLYKHSEVLAQDLREFFRERLCFGEFVFFLPNGQEVGRASDIGEFVDIVQKVPLASIHHHAINNDFSRWLLARGEIDLARKLKPKTVSDFKNNSEMRQHLVSAVMESRQEKRLGVITDFFEANFEFNETFTRLGGGSLGGKGRGLAFLAALLHRNHIREKFKECSIRLPDTLAIGTDIFDRFMYDNDLYGLVNSDASDDQIVKSFLKAKLPKDIRKSLKLFLSHVKEPLAVRSSSLLEDSQNQPFSGIYATYMIPNNSKFASVRSKHLCQAVKLVYASTFSKNAKSYIQSTLHQAEEKMAIVIQKIVGKEYDERFYPVFSGVARSFNYYPVEPLKREDGIVSLAFGLGKTVVDGGKVLNFSPVNPNILPGLSSTEDILNNTQNRFYSLNLKKESLNLIEGEDSTLNSLEIGDAEKDGTLGYVASTFDVNDDRLRDGIATRGPRVITFSRILKYNMLPLDKIIDELLNVGERGMGRPVEIEFAGTIDSQGLPEFYVLQIRPLVTLRERQQVKIENTDEGNSIIYSDSALGNGIIENVKDIVIVNPDKFDSLKTVEIAREIGEINNELKNIPYVLIGPGRWGTKDRFLGIPVEWDQISWAKAIIEVSLKDFRIDPSHGTHFFHNIISLGIMYFTIPYNSEKAFIKWDELNSVNPRIAKKYVTHIKLPYSVKIKVDGRNGKGVILKS